MARSNSGALAASAVLFSGPQSAKKVMCDNTGAALFLMLFDATALPANGAVPVFERAAPATAFTEFDFGAAGERFSTGLVAALSSTSATLTVAGAVGFFQATYY